MIMKIVKVLIFCSLFLGISPFTNPAMPGNLSVPIGDGSDDLIWNLDSLQRIPEFEYLDSTSGVREILFKGPDHKGTS